MGAACLISQDLQIDASISKNFKDTPDIIYGGIGVSWRSDLKYKEIRLGKSNKSKKGKNSKKDSKTDKTKKRFDDVPAQKPVTK